MQTLAALMPEPRPRPTGSAELTRFRHRLMSTLEELGLNVTVQEVRPCDVWDHQCRPVTNVLAIARGESPSIVLLMAHYDTAPRSPGAADNGASVAVLGELARNVRAIGRPRRTVLFLFTDAEEVDKAGAAGFFQHHPLARNVEVAINLDGSGSSGPSRLLRVAPQSGPYVRIYLQKGHYPLANSVRSYLFERLGSDSDFSEALSAGVPGLEFTFVGSRRTWHQPTDRLETLDPRTVQHHGENASALLHALAYNGELAGASEYLFVTIAPRRVLYWPSGVWSWVLVAAGGLAVLASVLGDRTITLRAVARGGGLTVAAVGASAAAAILALSLLDLFSGGRPAWPAFPWPWRAMLYAVPLVALWKLRTLFSRTPAWSLMTANVCLFVVTAIVCTAIDQRLAAPFIVTLAGNGAALLLLRATPPVWRTAGWLAAVGWTALVFFPTSHLAEVTYGFEAEGQILWPWIVVLATCTPVLCVGNSSVRAAST